MTDPEPIADALPHTQRRARRPQTDARLRRSRDKILGGVAAGIASFIDADPARVRWVFAIAAVLTAGIFVGIYGLLWLMLPVMD